MKIIEEEIRNRVRAAITSMLMGTEDYAEMLLSHDDNMNDVDKIEYLVGCLGVMAGTSANLIKSIALELEQDPITTWQFWLLQEDA